MKVSLKWLQDHVKVDLPVEDVAYRLTMCGLNCEAIEKHGDDHVFELEVASNRPDHLGHRGVARELACLLGIDLKPLNLDYPVVDKDPQGRSLDEVATVVVDDEDRCGRYTVRVAVALEPVVSPPWLQKRLLAVGLRSINLVVDLTNYVLMDLGQPLHAFDLDLLIGEEIVVRRALHGEKFEAIDGSQHELDSEDLVIADSTRAVALAGVMGGTQTEVSGTTHRILLESAWFDPVPIRETSRRLLLNSDSSYRFERRVDVDGADIASRRFFHLLCKETKTQVLSGCLETVRDGLMKSSPPITVRPQRTELILGVAIPEPEMAKMLSGLGFKHEATDSSTGTWTAPSWRADCTREIDLIEEIGRIYGLDQVPDRQMEVRTVPEDEQAQLVERVKSLLEGTGHHESLTFSFGSAEEFVEIEDWWCVGEPWVVRNPVRSNEGILRRSILPGLLSCVRGNRVHGVESVRLFEVARVFHRREGVDRPIEKIHLAWVHSIFEGLSGTEAYREVRGVADAVLDLLRIDKDLRSSVTWNPVPEDSSMIPGSTAALHISTDRLGIVGAVKLDGVTGETWCGELDLGSLIDHASVEQRFEEFSRQPGVRRDLNIVIADEILWRDISSEVEAAELNNLEDPTFVDMYRGKQVPTGHKSVTFNLTFRAGDRTLTHDEVDETVQELIERLQDRLQAKLRT